MVLPALLKAHAHKEECKVCQLQFLMAGLLINRQQASTQFKRELSKLKALRRIHNSFWQLGAVLVSQKQQKTILLYSCTTNKLVDWNVLTALFMTTILSAYI